VADDDVLHAPPVQLHSHHLVEKASEQINNVEMLVMKEELHEQSFPLKKEMEEKSRFELKPSDNSEEHHH
jgi:citrate lyase synthetase